MNPWLPILALLPALRPPAEIRPVVLHPVAKTAIHSDLFGGGNFTLTISPATINFNATNPSSAPVVPGNAPASVTWQNLDLATGSWTLAVQAGAASFANCPRIPISAVTVSCTSATANDGGTGTCSAPFALSTSPQIAAGGNQAVLTFSYAVTLNFILADSWKYIAETTPSCSLTLSYLATVP
jgi:hypothetical protein